MALSVESKKQILEVIKSCLRNKFENYEPKNNYMPFHFKLLGKDRMALYSFMQSLFTTFGTSIFEPVAAELAKSKFKKVETQHTIGNEIDNGIQNKVQEIINNLSINGAPNKIEELEQLKNSLNGKHNKLKPTKVDLYLETKDGERFLFDIKSAKPNKGEFQRFKQTLLEWAGIVYTKDKNAKVHTMIAIPYNPYHPEPYQMWTYVGMLDLKEEILVAENFWDFLAGKGVYDELLDCFEKAGIELRSEIDEYFSKFQK